MFSCSPQHNIQDHTDCGEPTSATVCKDFTCPRSLTSRIKSSCLIHKLLEFSLYTEGGKLMKNLSELYFPKMDRLYTTTARTSSLFSFL